MLLHDEEIKKCLGWVFVSPISRIDDGCITSLCHQFRATIEPAAYDDDISPHRIELKGRIDEGFTLRDA